MAVVGFLNSSSPDFTPMVRAFAEGVKETGYAKTWRIESRCLGSAAPQQPFLTGVVLLYRAQMGCAF